MIKMSIKGNLPNNTHNNMLTREGRIYAQLNF